LANRPYQVFKRRWLLKSNLDLSPENPNPFNYKFLKANPKEYLIKVEGTWASTFQP